MEEAVRLFSAAFAQVCALKEVQPITLQRIWERVSALENRVSRVMSWKWCLSPCETGLRFSVDFLWPWWLLFF